MGTRRRAMFVVIIMPVVLLTLLQFAATRDALVVARTPQETESGDLPQTPVVVRLTYADETADPAEAQAGLNELAAWLDIWEVDPEARTLLALVSPDEYAFLVASGYSLEIDSELTQQVLVPPGYPCYRTVEQLYATLAQTVTLNYPEITEFVDYGDSWEKVIPGGLEGYELYVLEITNEAIPGPKPVAVIDAGIHSREMAPPEVAMALVDLLTTQYGHDPDVTWLVDYHKTAIPIMMNPDGRKKAEDGVWWRKNTDNDDGCSNPNSWGVDLNRNFSVQWGCCGGSSPEPCDETYRGPSPSSEPETYFYQSYVESQIPDQWHYTDTITTPAPLSTTGILINMHSYGEWVLYPWGYTDDDAPNDAGLRAIAEKYGAMSGYIARRSLYPVDGVLRDWAYGDLGIPAFTLEMGTAFFQNCYDLPGIIAENLPALSYVIRIARTPYKLVHGPDVLNLTLTPSSTVGAPPVQLNAIINDAQNGGQTIAAAAYYVDVPPWITATAPISYPMMAADGAFDEVVEPVWAELDIRDLPSGRHTLFVQGQDADGHWGPLWSTWITVTRGWITGTVVDDWTSAPISAADLTLATPSWIYTTQTDASGQFSEEVFSGVYTVTAAATGYYSTSVAGVTVHGGLTTSLQLSLTPCLDDLSITKTVTPLIAGPGQVVTYTLVYLGRSPQTSHVTGTLITDVVPSLLTDLSFAYSGAAITPTGGLSYTWQVADWSGEQAGAITVTGRVSPGVSGLFSLTNRAAFTASVADGRLSNNLSIVTHTIDAEAPLAPSLFSPADGTVVSDTQLALVWQPSPSPDLAGYKLSWTGVPLDVGDVTQYTVTLSTDGVYTWTVAAYDRLGNVSPYTDVWSLEADVTPPQVQQTVPANGALDVALEAPVLITFSEAIKPGSLVYAVAPDPDGWEVAWSPDGTAVTLDHNPFAYQRAYTVSVGAAKDLVGNPLTDAPVEWSFTTIACAQVTGVTLTQVTTGSLYPGDWVAFRADLVPDGAVWPYHYRVALDGTPGAEMSATLEPLVFSDTFDVPGTHAVEIAVWNCEMTEGEAVTDSLTLVVDSPPPTCTQVSGITLTPVNTDTIYAGDVVTFSAEVLPAEATEPYTYVVDYGDGTLLLPASSWVAPLIFAHTYDDSGIYLVEIALWNCQMSETMAVTAAYTLTVYEVCVALESIEILGETAGEPGLYTFSTHYLPTGASLPITYTWDNGDDATTTVRNLEVGTHTLTVAAINCADVVVSDTHQIVISQPGFRFYLPVVIRDA